MEPLSEHGVAAGEHGRRERGGDPRVTDADAGEIGVAEVTALHAMLLAPVPFAAVGEEVVVDVVIAGQQLERLDPVVRAEVRHEGDTPPPSARHGPTNRGHALELFHRRARARRYHYAPWTCRYSASP